MPLWRLILTIGSIVGGYLLALLLASPYPTHRRLIEASLVPAVNLGRSLLRV